MLNSYLLNPVSKLFGGGTEHDFVVRIGPYPQWTQATIHHSLTIDARSPGSEHPEPVVTITPHHSTSVPSEPFANFTRAFKTFLHWMVMDHPQASESAEDESAHSLNDEDHDDTSLEMLLPEDVKVWLAQTKLQQLRCTLHILRSPTTRELCITFQINHSSEFALTTTANPTHGHTLTARLRHLLLCYRSVAPYLGAQALDNSFQIAAVYLLAPPPEGNPKDPLICKHVWGQRKIRWQFLTHNRQLDPFSPYVSHYEFYAAVWHQVIGLVGPGTPTAKDRHSVWLAGDTDGSLGLRLWQEGHDLMSFHFDQEATLPHRTPSPRPVSSFWQQLHALNPNLSTASAHYIELERQGSPQGAFTSCWSHHNTDPKRPTELTQDMARLPTYLIIITSSPSSENEILDVTRQLLQISEHAQTQNSVQPKLPHFLILITADPLHELWDNLHNTADQPCHHDEAHSPPPQASFQYQIQALGYGAKQCIGFEMIPPGTSAHADIKVLRRLFISLYETQHAHPPPARQPADPP